MHGAVHSIALAQGLEALTEVLVELHVPGTTSWTCPKGHTIAMQYGLRNCVADVVEVEMGTEALAEDKAAAVTVGGRVIVLVDVVVAVVVGKVETSEDSELKKDVRVLDVLRLVVLVLALVVVLVGVAVVVVVVDVVLLREVVVVLVEVVEEVDVVVEVVLVVDEVDEVVLDVVVVVLVVVVDVVSVEVVVVR